MSGSSTFSRGLGKPSVADLFAKFSANLERAYASGAQGREQLSNEAHQSSSNNSRHATPSASTATPPAKRAKLTEHPDAANDELNSQNQRKRAGRSGSSRGGAEAGDDSASPSGATGRSAIDDLLALDEIASSRGLSPQELTQLGELVIQHAKKREEGLSARLLRVGGIPATTVPFPVVARLAASLPLWESKLQVVICKFISLVQDLVTPPEQMASLYQVFFHHLQHARLRAVLSTVLFRLTRQPNVTVARIRNLARWGHLAEAKQDVPVMFGLWSLYREYVSRMDPSLPSTVALLGALSGDLSTQFTESISAKLKARTEERLSVAFRCPDPSWLERIMAVAVPHRRFQTLAGEGKVPATFQHPHAQYVPLGLPLQYHLMESWIAKLPSPNKSVDSSGSSGVGTAGSSSVARVGGSPPRLSSQTSPTSRRSTTIQTPQRSPLPSSSLLSSAATAAGAAPLRLAPGQVGQLAHIDYVRSTLIQAFRSTPSPPPQKQLLTLLLNRFTQHCVMLESGTKDATLARLNHALELVLESAFSWHHNPTRGTTPTGIMEVGEGENAEAAASSASAAQSSELDQVREQLLRHLVSFARSTHETPIATVRFLFRYLRSWDGESYFDLIMELVGYLPPTPWEDLYAGVLHPLTRLVFGFPPVKRAAVLNACANMLRRWVAIDWTAYYEAMRGGGSGSSSGSRGGGIGGGRSGASSINSNSDTTVPTTSSPPPHMSQAGVGSGGTYDSGASFAPLDPAQGADYYKTIYEFVQFFDKLATLLLQDSGSTYLPYATMDDVVVQFATLNLFDITAQLHCGYGIPFVVPPSPTLLYRCVLSQDAAAVSRICGIVAQYKIEFERLKLSMTPAASSAQDASASPSPSPQQAQSVAHPHLSFSSGAEKIQTLNGYIWTLSKALWRQRLFHQTEGTGPASAAAQDDLMLPAELVQHLAPGHHHAALSLSHSPAFLSFACHYLRDLQQDSTSLSHGNALLKPDLIRDVVKVQYVDYLRDQGLLGLHDFLYTFIGTLAKRRKPSPGAGLLGSEHPLSL